MIEHTTSAGSVFDDLGFTAAETVVMKLRAHLMTQLRDFIVTNCLKQSEVASLFNVTQPRVSDLVRGRLSLFSIDSLLEMAVRAGLHPEVQVAAPPKPAQVFTVSYDSQWQSAPGGGNGWELSMPQPVIAATDTALAKAA
jgi:predicted XRE-type DNA-binding protein